MHTQTLWVFVLLILSCECHLLTLCISRNSWEQITAGRLKSPHCTSPAWTPQVGITLFLLLLLWRTAPAFLGAMGLDRWTSTCLHIWRAPQSLWTGSQPAAHTQLLLVRFYLAQCRHQHLMAKCRACPWAGLTGLSVTALRLRKHSSCTSSVVEKISLMGSPKYHKYSLFCSTNIFFFLI